MDDQSKSFWMTDVEMPRCPKLTEDLVVDACIVGGGLGGLMTAYQLVREGLSVCVIESATLGSGQTGRTTAQFVTALDERYIDLEKHHGEAGSRSAADSHKAALKEVERIISEEKIECDFSFVDGYLFLGVGSPSDLLDRELKAAKRAGIDDVTSISHVPLKYFKTAPSLLFPRQIQIHPLKFLKGLAQFILARGSKIYTHTHVVDVKGGVYASVKTKNGHTIKAKNIIVATNSPINDLFAIHTKQAPYRSYVVALNIPKASVPRAFYWDTEDPFHYVRLANLDDESDLLIVGGEDHKTGQNAEPVKAFERLEKWTRERFPFARQVAYRWSGQVMESIDGLGFLGRNPLDHDNVFIITGDSGNGMTHCLIGAMMIRDQIKGVEVPWESLYNPSRINLRATGPFLKENANVAAQFGDWFSGKPFDELEAIKPGEGAVFRKGLHQIAVYKDESGSPEFCSAVCPHLGCIVTWNNSEKSWDCPCHGSRFNCHGKVIEGPASSDLETYQNSDTDMEGIPITNSSRERVGAPLALPEGI